MREYTQRLVNSEHQCAIRWTVSLVQFFRCILCILFLFYKNERIVAPLLGHQSLVSFFLSFSSPFSVLSSFISFCSGRMIGRESHGRRGKRWKILEGPSRSGYANWASLVPHVLAYKHIDLFDKRACSFLHVYVHTHTYMHNLVRGDAWSRFCGIGSPWKEDDDEEKRKANWKDDAMHTSSLGHREHIRVFQVHSHIMPSSVQAHRERRRDRDGEVGAVLSCAIYARCVLRCV